MFINITDSQTGNNKGSSRQLVHYLDKEARLFDSSKPEQWFNGVSNAVFSYEVSSRLDSNTAKLGKDDAKFFLINISPSQKEIAWLKAQYGEDGAKNMLKAFAVGIMDEYARNFNRPGINSSKDLLWFGKLENHRYYSHKDPEVKQGSKKRGEAKPGEQMHIQVIVSRKDITNKIKLSPMNKSRGKNTAHSKKVGQFDRSAFKASGERLFDEQFRFKRDLTDTFRYANTQKKGNLQERIAMRKEIRKPVQKCLESSIPSTNKKQPVSLLEKSRKDTAQDLLHPTPDKFLQTLTSTKSSNDGTPLIPRKKGKRRKGIHL